MQPHIMFQSLLAPTQTTKQSLQPLLLLLDKGGEKAKVSLVLLETAAVARRAISLLFFGHVKWQVGREGGETLFQVI